MTTRHASDSTSASPQGAAPRADGPWDLVVVGGGTAGLVASRTAASLGSRVLLVEGGRLGGDCLWTGCVPSKALAASARAAHIARASGALGVHADPRVDVAAVREHVRRAIAHIEPVDSAEALERDGVAVLHGRARFTSPRELVVDGEPVLFRQALVATGASPVLPRFDGADALDIHSSDTIWDLPALPERLLVIGGGPLGCEFAQALARLGSAVTLVSRGRRLLEAEDERAARVLHAALEADGVDIRLGRSVVRGERGPQTRDSGERAGARLTLDDGQVLDVDAVLAGVGRRPNVAGLGLDSAGVRLSSRGGIAVDRRLRTSSPRIWAAGDVTGSPYFTHTAGVQGSTAALNAVLGLSRGHARAAQPRVTFTDPEVASVGVRPSEARRRGLRVLSYGFEHLDRAVADGDTSGFSELVVDDRGRLLGATIVGPRAGEALGEVSLAIAKRLSTTDLALATHAYPTYADAVWNPAVGDAQARLARGAVGRGIRLLKALRDARLR